MSRTPLEALRELRRAARQQVEARFGVELAALRAAEEQFARCAHREAIHVSGRLAVASSRLSALEDPVRGAGAPPGLDSPVCQAQLHETRERLLRAQESLLAYGRQRAAHRVAESMGRVAAGQALLIDAELRLEVVERFLADRAAAERARLQRREEREADDARYSSSRNSSL